MKDLSHSIVRFSIVSKSYSQHTPYRVESTTGNGTGFVMVSVQPQSFAVPINVIRIY